MHIAVLAATTITAAAADAGSLPSAVLWAAGIAAFLGFIVGSVPPSGPNRGWEFDMGGAVVWAVSAALVVGGLFSYALTTGQWTTTLFPIGLGTVLGMVRIVGTLPARALKSGDLQPGIHRAPGDTLKRKLKAAQRMYNNASFRWPAEDNYYASRGIEHYYGKTGLPTSHLNGLRYHFSCASENTFDILVILVRALPDEHEQPAVAVVRGCINVHNLRLQLDADGILIPGYEKKIPLAQISAMVGYAWR